MLILGRRIGERIHIGDHVELQVLGIKGQEVRLGVSAPAKIAVYREEIYQRIQAQQSDEDGSDSP